MSGFDFCMSALNIVHRQHEWKVFQSLIQECGCLRMMTFVLYAIALFTCASIIKIVSMLKANPLLNLLMDLASTPTMV